MPSCRNPNGLPNYYCQHCHYREHLRFAHSESTNSIKSIELKPLRHIKWSSLPGKHSHLVDESLRDIVNLILDVRQGVDLVQRRYLLASPVVMLDVQRAEETWLFGRQFPRGVPWRLTRINAVTLLFWTLQDHRCCTRWEQCGPRGHISGANRY